MYINPFDELSYTLFTQYLEIANGKYKMELVDDPAQQGLGKDVMRTCDQMITFNDLFIDEGDRMYAFNMDKWNEYKQLYLDTLLSLTWEIVPSLVHDFKIDDKVNDGLFLVIKQKKDVGYCGIVVMGESLCFPTTHTEEFDPVTRSVCKPNNRKHSKRLTYGTVIAMSFLAKEFRQAFVDKINASISTADKADMLAALLTSDPKNAAWRTIFT